MTFAPELTLSSITRARLDAYLRDPHGGLLLSGDEGCGLKTLALHVGAALNPAPEATMFIEPEEAKDITIEQIRRLYHQTHSARQSALTVVIDDAERMSLPAQNAFLKLLEEPPQRVVFVLTSHTPQQLLATILSRVSMIRVQPISAAASSQLIREQGITDATMQAQLLFLASGKPAGLMKLIRQPEYFAKRADHIKTARAILQSSPYERLVTLTQFASNRTQALAIVRTMGDVAQFGLKKTNDARTVHQLGVIAAAIENLEANANVRLQLLHLALSLSL